MSPAAKLFQEEVVPAKIKKSTTTSRTGSGLRKGLGMWCQPVVQHGQQGGAAAGQVVGS